nr:hypothetical protein [uncultured Fusobacterium sp.]
MKKVVDEKVIQVKEAIKKFGEETVEKIVTRKKENRIFYTNKKFEEWLQENYKAFTKKELKILKFEMLETTIKQQETTKEIEVETPKATNDLQEATDKKGTVERETTEDLQEATNEKEKTTTKQQETTEKIEPEILEATNKLQETTDKKEEKNTDDLQETTNKTSLVISERLKNEELGKKFLYFLDNIDEFISIGRKAENDLLIPNEILLMSSFSTSLRISREVLDKFNKFCNEHKNYSKIQILNFALLEFVNKYTKE